MLSPCHHLTLTIPEQPNLCHSHIGQSFKMICGGHQRSVHTANQRATPLSLSLYSHTNFKDVPAGQSYQVGILLCECYRSSENKQDSS